MYQNLAPNTLVEHPNGILHFNGMMEEKAGVSNLNERSWSNFWTGWRKPPLFMIISTGCRLPASTSWPSSAREITPRVASSR